MGQINPRGRNPHPGGGPGTSTQALPHFHEIFQDRLDESQRKLAAMRPLLIVAFCLSVIVQSPKTHTDNKQNAHPQVDQAANDQNTSDTGNAPENQFYTYNNQNSEGQERPSKISDYLLAAFTLALVIVGILQTLILRKHEGWMQKHDANLVKLAEVSQKTLVASFRPKVTIRSILFRSPDKVEYTVVNQGGTRAHLMSSNITVTDITSVNGWLPAKAPYSDADNILGKIALEPGDYKRGEITLDAAATRQIATDLLRKKGGSPDKGSVHCLGYIQYMDGNMVVRYTAFCRLFNVQRERFVPVDDSDYEYQD
jgi:hypothetical protein